MKYLYDDPVIFKYFNLTSSFFLLGTLALVVVLNALSIFQFRLSKSNNIITGTVAVKTKILNIAAIGLGGLLMCILLGYAFIENYSDYIVSKHF